jgi:phosphatidylinositol kinase/protein kinase (PI-3  family)
VHESEGLFEWRFGLYLKVANQKAERSQRFSVDQYLVAKHTWLKHIAKHHTCHVSPTTENYMAVHVKATTL